MRSLIRCHPRYMKCDRQYRSHRRTLARSRPQAQEVRPMLPAVGQILYQLLQVPDIAHLVVGKDLGPRKIRFQEFARHYRFCLASYGQNFIVYSLGVD